jgi:hypothetical protein
MPGLVETSDCGLAESAEQGGKQAGGKVQRFG